MDYYQILKAERERLQEKEKLYTQAVEKLPDGNLTTNRNGSYTKYYLAKDGKRQYLSSSEASLIEDLAKKKYLQAELKDVQAEGRAIDLYLKYHKENSFADELLARGDGVSDLLKSLVAPRDKKLQDWAEAEYPSYQGFPEALVHQGPFGKMYRSKTEANIAYLLVKNHIPQRYEWEQSINGTLYPIDFTTRHPVTEQYIYWEHFGRMDDWAYCMKIGPKLYDFASAGIIADKNLILTFESKNNPMNISQLEDIIRRWYL